MATGAVAVYSVGSSGRTKKFIGFGSLVAPDVVALHPQAQPAPPLTPRLRCVVPGDPTEQQIFDGIPAPSAQGAKQVPAVVLSGVPKQASGVEEIWSGFTFQDPTDDLVQHIETYLAGQSQRSPVQPLPAASVKAPRKRPPKRPPGPELKPPWCSIWGGGWGC